MWSLSPPVQSNYFAPDQKNVVVALFDAILPSGPTNPGATDAGAADYLDQLLARDESVYYEIKDWRPLYSAGLAMISAASNTRFGKPIDQLTRDQVTALLAELKDGKLPNFPTPAWQTSFFGVIRAHCIEGCFADARWGGNKNNVIWKWYGYPAGPSQAWPFPPPLGKPALPGAPATPTKP